MPWNFPLWQVFRFLAPALMAGNIGLLKHASNVPQCALQIEALVRRAGFPRGVFQTSADRNQIRSSSSSPTTASPPSPSPALRPRVAPSPRRPAGSSRRPSSSSAAPTPSSSCLGREFRRSLADRSCQLAVKARTINNGQSCIAAKRFLIHTDIYDRFEQAFVAAMEALKVGDPTQDTTDIGPARHAADRREPAECRSAPPSPPAARCSPAATA